MAWLPVVWLIIVIQLSFIVTARDVSPQKENYLPDYRLYHNISRIEETLQHLLTSYSDRLFRYNSPQSGEGRRVSVLRLPPDGSKLYGTQNVKRVLMVFGEHAREFLPTESALTFLQNILSKPNLPLARLLRNHFDVYVIPILNPDGRARIEKSANYCWRGTGSGVDLSRNFAWEFGTGTNSVGSSVNQNDEEYRGSSAFSEAESRIVRDITEKIPFDAALSIHSGIRHIYIPYSDSRSRKIGRKPQFWKPMEVLASKMKVAMGSDPKYSFKAGPAAELNDYTADGTMFDYLAGVRHIPVSLAVELWGVGDVPGVKCFDLFNPRSNLLREEVHHLLPLYEAFFTGLWTMRANFTKNAKSVSVPRPGSLPPYPLIALIAVACLILGLLCKHHLRTPHNSWRLLTNGRKRVVSLRSFSSRFSGLTSLKSV